MSARYHLTYACNDLLVASSNTEPLRSIMTEFARSSFELALGGNLVDLIENAMIDATDMDVTYRQLAEVAAKAILDQVAPFPTKE